MAVRLFIVLDDSGGNNQELDLDQGTIIEMRKQFIDYKGVTKRQSDFTQTFQLPSTATNLQFFGYPQDVGFESESFEFTKITNCLLYDGNSLILRANLQFISYSRLNKKINVVLYGKLNTIQNTLGQKTMAEIDLTDLYHEHNQSNIESSWSQFILNGDLVYPIADYGYGYGTNVETLPNGNPGFWNLADSASPFYLELLRPAVRVRKLLYALFESNGLILESAYLDSSYFDDIFCQLHTKEMFPTDTVISNTVAYYQETTRYTITTTEERLPFKTDTVTPYYDNVLYQFEAVVQGSYTFKYDIFTNGGNAAHDNILRIYKYVAGLGTTNLLYTFTQAQTDSYFTGEFSEPLTSGSLIYMTIETTVANAGNFIDNSYNNYFTLVSFFPVFTNRDVYPQLYMADVKQIDFLVSVLDTFNLILVPSKDIDTAYIIYSVEDYYTNAEQKNWSDKIDLGSEILIKPITELVDKEVRLSWEESPMLEDKRYRDKAGIPFGGYTQQSGVAYSEGTKELKNIFMGYPVKSMYKTAGETYPVIAMPRYYAEEGNTSLVDMKPQLFIYSGRVDRSVLTDRPWYSYASGDFLTQLEWYPVALPWRPTKISTSLWTIDEDDYELNFQSTYPFNPGANSLVSCTFYAPPDNNLFTTHWQIFFNEFYQPTQRYVTMQMVLTPDDIEEFEWNDIIELDWDGTPEQWRVASMDKYRLGTTRGVKVELLKAYTFQNIITPTFSIINSLGTIVDEYGNAIINNTGIVTYTLDGTDCIYDDGITQPNYLDLDGERISSINPHRRFTWEIWWTTAYGWPSGNITEHYMMGKGGSITGDQADARWRIASGAFYFWLFDHIDGTRFYTQHLTSQINETIWNYTVVRYDGSGDPNNVVVWNNGILWPKNNISDSGYITPPSRRSQVQISREYDGSSVSSEPWYFNRVRWTPRYLTDADITNNYTGDLPNYPRLAWMNIRSDGVNPIDTRQVTAITNYGIVNANVGGIDVLYTDGTNNYLYLAGLSQVAEIQNNVPFTMTVWAYWSTLSNQYFYTKGGDAGATRAISIEYVAGRYFMWIGDGTTYFRGYSDVNVPSTGAWHLIVWTFDGVSNYGGINIYVDAAQQNITYDNTPTTPTTVNKAAVSGRNDLDGGLYSGDGYMDRLRHFQGHVFTATDVLDLWNSEKAYYGY